MQPYVNPSFFNQYQNYPYNPLMNQQQQRLNQMEQAFPQFAQQPQMQQQNTQPALINGRVVDDISTVTANEVPMTGECAVFPMRDLSAMYVKQWGNDGTIKTVKFTPILDELNNLPKNEEKLKIDPSDEFTGALMQRFDELEKKIDKVVSSKMETTTKSRVKKESDPE